VCVCCVCLCVCKCCLVWHVVNIKYHDLRTLKTLFDKFQQDGKVNLCYLRLRSCVVVCLALICCVLSGFLTRLFHMQNVSELWSTICDIVAKSIISAHAEMRHLYRKVFPTGRIISCLPLSILSHLLSRCRRRWGPGFYALRLRCYFG
jgi:hypothetical protein